MNYRHIYHAGNFADVFKHWILTLILSKLSKKTTPFCLFDTHAGLGFYDLQDVNAQKTLEFKSGVARLLDKTVAPEFNDFIRLIIEYNRQYSAYPGSPAIMQAFMRATDRLILSELHPADYQTLKHNFKDDRRITTLQQSGYATLKALLPPLERRGLILIDPPFEKDDEFEQIIISIKESLKRFANGIYAIWYPIKDRKAISQFYNNLEKTSAASILVIELHANESILNQLNSCGMVVINPPWQLEETLKSAMPNLISYLNFNRGTFDLRALKL